MERGGVAVKIVLKTIYENVDGDFLAWYIKQLKSEHVPIDFDDFENGEKVVLQSKDPTSEVIGTTTYQVLR